MLQDGVGHAIRINTESTAPPATLLPFIPPECSAGNGGWLDVEDARGLQVLNTQTLKALQTMSEDIPLM